MHKSTPPKHRTPNYKLVTHINKVWNKRKNGLDVSSWSTWEAQPLRADRKD